MSPESFGALLTLIGLVAEVVAVIAILIAVGMPARVAGRLQGMWQKLVRASLRTARFIRRLWPWSSPESPQVEAVLGTMRSGGSSSVSLELETGVAAPKTFAEVGEQLDELRANWNEHQEKLEKQADELRVEIADLESRSAVRVEKIDLLIKEEARRTLAERTTEGLILAFGLLFQVVGAAAILFDWSPL